MKGQEVVLTDMLACRERRVNIQNEYIQRYHCPVISFCMNIPGPIKTNEQIKKAFLSGKEALFAVLQKENIPILTQTEFDEKTGNEIILTVDYPADRIKELTTEIEETHPFGRLFDMDVIGTDGEKLSLFVKFHQMHDRFDAQMFDLRLSGTGMCPVTKAYRC